MKQCWWFPKNGETVNRVDPVYLYLIYPCGNGNTNPFHLPWLH